MMCAIARRRELPRSGNRRDARRHSQRHHTLQGLSAISVLVCMALASWVGLAQADAPKEHLLFFHENRAFILQAWENVRASEVAAVDRSRDWDFDPFAQWNARDAVQEARARLDSATTPDHLGAFHASLDSLLEEMQRAAVRLDDLDFRFSAHVRTGLEVTLATPRELDIVRIEADVEGKPTIQHDLTGAERAALVRGGVLEVLRQVVEPRVHHIEVRTWTRGSSQPSITQMDFHPTADRVVRLHLQLKDPEEPAVMERTLVAEGS